MIPFSDDIQGRTLPVVTVLLILLNSAVFLYQLSLPAEQLEAFIRSNGVIPARLAALGSQPAETLVVTARSMFGSLFVHGGWWHLIGNMLYLWVFGDNIEDRMGHLRFLLFYLLCGMAAGVAHQLANPASTVPAIGASGAVAGVLGAYLLCYPFARVLTLIPLFLLWPVVQLPALVVLGGWFFLQLLNGVAAIGVSAQTAGVAWWAHIGGFLAGLLLLPLFDRPQPRRYYYDLGEPRGGGGFPA